MKNLSANKAIVLAACAASTVSSKATATTLSTSTARSIPWVVKNIPRGGSKNSSDDDGSPNSTKKSSSSQNRSGKKKKSTKTAGDETKTTSLGGNSDRTQHKSSGKTDVNPILEEILRQDNLYNVLGVSKSASDREITKAYRKRCVQTHPDKTGGDRRAFDKVSEAYDVLSDSSKRQIYDQYGKTGLDPTNPNNGASFGASGGAAEMFRNMFQQAQQQRQQQQRRNQTLRYQLEVTLEDLYYGRTQNVVVTPPRSRRQGYQQRQQRKEVEVHIEKGSISGQAVVMSGEVDFNDDDSPPGDLVFILTQTQHSTFTRKGHDLAMELTISLEEALCGLRRSIRHIDGSELWIESATRQTEQSKSENGMNEEISSNIDGNDDTNNIMKKIPTIIRSGDVQVLKGRGMPKRNKNGEFGDLYIQYRVEMPQNSKGSRIGSALTKEEYKELSRLLSKLEGSNGMRYKNDGTIRRRKVSQPPKTAKVHSLQEAKPSDFGTASGKVDLEEEEGPGQQDFNPFASSFFGAQGFGDGRSYSQQFHFGGPGGPFGTSSFGSSGMGDDGDVQCQQM